MKGHYEFPQIIPTEDAFPYFVKHDRRYYAKKVIASIEKWPAWIALILSIIALVRG